MSFQVVSNPFVSATTTTTTTTTAAAAAAVTATTITMNGHCSIGETTTYRPVFWKKSEGSLILSGESIAFCPTTNDGTTTTTTTTTTATTSFSLFWANVTKHQVSPANYPKALLKVTTTDNGKAVTFQLCNREELQRLREDISIRLRRYRSNNNASSSKATVSGKKRPHFEMLEASSNRNQNSISELDSTALAVTRSAILAANPSLRSQHQFLVEEAKTVSEDDFWKTHEHLLQEEYARICGMTRAGTSSLLQSHLPLQGRVTLGVEEMRQIFILYPAVHKAYEEKVPLELSDEQFWRKYLESEYFHRDRGRLGTAARNHASSSEAKDKLVRSAEEQDARAAAVGTDDLFSRYDQKINEQSGDGVTAPNGAASGKKWGTRLAVGQFDLASTFQTERGDLLEGPRDNHPPNAADDGKGARVIQKYNRHWAMVLHPEEAVAGSNLLDVARRSVHDVLEGDEDAKARGGLYKETKRLVGFSMASGADVNHALGIRMSDSDCCELILNNVEAYYSGQVQQSNSAVESEKKATFLSVKIAKQLREVADKIPQEKQNGETNAALFQQFFPPPVLGENLLKALTKKMAADSKINAGTLEVVKTLPEDFLKRLHSYFLRSSELLRHFFGLRKLEEAQGTTFCSEKLAGIVSGMETFYREMEEMRKQLPQTEIGEVMRKMCLPIMDQLDWAFTLNREGVGGGGSGGFVTVDSGFVAVDSGFVPVDD